MGNIYIMLSLLFCGTSTYIYLLSFDETGRFSRIDCYPFLTRYFFQIVSFGKQLYRQLIKEITTPHARQSADKKRADSLDNQEDNPEHSAQQPLSTRDTLNSIYQLSEQLEELTQRTQSRKQAAKEPRYIEDFEDESPDTQDSDTSYFTATKEATCFEDFVRKSPEMQDMVDENATQTQEHDHDPLPDNVIPLAEHREAPEELPEPYKHLIGAKQISLSSKNGERYVLTEEETALFKESIREGYNMPSNPREHQFREFIESFYFTDIDFSGDLSKLAYSLASMRYDAMNLLIIETDFGTQYENINYQLREKPSKTTPVVDDED